MIRATLDGEVVRDQLIVLAPPGGSRRSVLVNAWPVRDGEDRLVAGVATHVDVTSQIEADNARDAFLGVLSHELRTPITSIYAGAELLARRIIDDEATRELAAGVADEANRLHRLVENLLVLSRVERGADLHRDDPVLLHHLARRVLAYEADRWPGARFELVDAADAAGDHGRRLVRRADHAQPAVERREVRPAGRRDPARPGARGRVRHRSGCSTRARGSIPGSEERVFDLFYRAPSAARTAPGAGIGLYAVRALASAMNGRVWARNRPEGGAEVGVELPVVEAA